MTLFRQEVKCIATHESEEWHVTVFADAKEIGTLHGFTNSAAASQAGEYLQVGFIAGFKLFPSVSEEMRVAGIEAMESAELDGLDRPSGEIEKRELVGLIYDAMQQAMLSEHWKP